MASVNLTSLSLLSGLEANSVASVSIAASVGEVAEICSPEVLGKGSPVGNGATGVRVARICSGSGLLASGPGGVVAAEVTVDSSLSKGTALIPAT